jgi:hypothetical protein
MSTTSLSAAAAGPTVRQGTNKSGDTMANRHVDGLLSTVPSLTSARGSGEREPGRSAVRSSNYRHEGGIA